MEILQREKMLTLNKSSDPSVCSVNEKTCFKLEKRHENFESKSANEKVDWKILS